MAVSNTDTKLLQDLKQRFPEIPEGIVSFTIKQNRNDKPRCIEELEKESPKYMYGEFQTASSTNMIPTHEVQNLHLQDDRRSPAPSTSSSDERRWSNSSAPGALMHSHSAQEFRGSNEQMNQMTEPQSAPVIPQNYQPFDRGYMNSPPKYTSTLKTNVSQQSQQTHYTPGHSSPYNRSPSGSFTGASCTTTPTHGSYPSSQYISTAQQYVSPSRNPQMQYASHGNVYQSQHHTGSASPPVLHPPQYYTTGGSYGQYPNPRETGQQQTQQKFTSHTHRTLHQQYSSPEILGHHQQYTTPGAGLHRQYTSPETVGLQLQYTSPSASVHQQYTNPESVGHQQQHTSSSAGVQQHYTNTECQGHQQQYASPSAGQHQQTFTSSGSTGHQYVKMTPTNQFPKGGVSPQQPPPCSATSLHYYPVHPSPHLPQSGSIHPGTSSNTFSVTLRPQNQQAGGATGGSSDGRVVSSCRFTPTQPQRPNLSQQLSCSPVREPDILTRSIEGSATPPPPIQPVSPASSHSSLLESPLDEIHYHQSSSSVASGGPAALTKEQEDYAYTQALLLHQKARCDRLVRDLEDESSKLNRFRREVEQMEKDLMERRSRSSRLPNAEHIAKLRGENRSLQTDIQLLSREVELIRSDQVQAVDQTSSFYRNIGSTGAPGPIPPKPPDNSSMPPTPPQAPPTPTSSHCPGAGAGAGAASTTVGEVGVLDSEEGQQWSCVHCTFLNHPALDKCECCEMPRVV
ncbi:TGF-beta-activated kinase 1 and MAP3K7-binding protein 3-like [Glandiceps talaboti]